MCVNLYVFKNLYICFLYQFRLPSSELLEIIKGQCPWNKDEYMKPYDPSDPLLTFGMNLASTFLLKNVQRFLNFMSIGVD